MENFWAWSRWSCIDRWINFWHIPTCQQHYLCGFSANFISECDQWSMGTWPRSTWSIFFTDEPVHPPMFRKGVLQLSQLFTLSFGTYQERRESLHTGSWVLPSLCNGAQLCCLKLYSLLWRIFYRNFVIYREVTFILFLLCTFWTNRQHYQSIFMNVLLM